MSPCTCLFYYKFMSDKSFRTIQSIGRTELINELMEDASVQHDFVLKGVGDDASVFKKGDELQLYSSETFMEGVDFDLTYVPLHHLGYKVTTAAVSDIYAMNGTPEALLVNVSVPNKISVDMLKEVYRGIHAACKDYNVQITGGDLAASHQILSISITSVGRTEEKKVTYRKGAEAGDALCLTGDLGGAIAGLRILMREKQFWEKQNQQEAFQPDLEDYEYVVKRQLVPIARKDFINQLDELDIKPDAMIDVTQGLANDLKNLTQQSKVGAYIYQAAIPIALDTRSVADEMKEDVDKYALYGGEDFEIMFTLPEDKVETLAEKFEDFTVIGKITPHSEGVCMQKAEGEVVRFDDED